MENVNLFDIRSCWGNLSFDFVVGPSVGNSGGILCVWDSNIFHKENSTVSDYFIAIMGKWLPNDRNYLIISIYAPQDLSEKKMLWQYLAHIIGGWNGDVIIMGDFNEVRFEAERFGSIFNARGAAVFNSFISSSGLVEVPSGGYSFTWAHKSATKMSKLDRFLISEALMRNCPNISSITLDRFLSDHRPILLREICLDYGPTPFRFFHHWFGFIGFDSFVFESWKDIQIQDQNAMLNFAKKLKILKGRIRSWVKDEKEKAHVLKNSLKKKLADIDSIVDKGEVTSDVLEVRLDTMNSLTKLENMESIELAQKAKIKWSIEGDENSKYFHGIINKKRNNLAIRGIIVDGEWIEDPNVVKNEFLSHFRNRFDSPCNDRLTLDMVFPNVLSHDQAQDLERAFSKDEIKQAVWDCGLDKSPGPDGFTFGFYRKFWSLLEDDVVDAVCFFYSNGFCLKGINSSFIALIPKSQGANLVKDFRPISLIGSIYKIIAKLLANRFVTVLDGLVDFEKAFDSVCWDFLDDILKKFSFGPRWRDWIQCCLKSSRGSILINGSPTSESQFYKGLKQGDPLSPLLFILVVGLFKGVGLDNSLQLSHADDVVFIGQWCDSNLATIMRVLECFFRASGLRINRQKCGLMGIAVEPNKIANAAKNLGCKILKTPFSYLGVNIGGNMTRINSWDVVINKTLSRLSKWKLKVLSIGGRLTLLKSVLGSISIYYMSMFRAPIQVINKLESIRSHFFNGVDHNVRKTFWGWRFRANPNSLWSRAIRAIHGFDGKLGNPHKPSFSSNWIDIVRAIHRLKQKSIDLHSFVNKKVGNGVHTYFWEDSWRGETTFKILFPRIYALEKVKDISMAEKMAHPSISFSFRREPRSGDGEFSVSSARKLIDDKTLGMVGSKTNWCKFVPIKVNILSWRVKLNNLPTRLNLSRRGMELLSIFCPSCNMAVESTNHIFFACSMMNDLYKAITSWWDIKALRVSSYEEWWSWFSSLRLSHKIKMVLQDLEVNHVLVG
ncbi:RNA-directed DNA polymerase, eukaryota [Tanacetum coccineum]